MAVDIPRNKRPKQTRFTGTSDGQHWFEFRCLGCGCWGTLGVRTTDRDPIGCPEGCGATYILWIPNKTPVLNCVCKPIRRTHG